MTGREIAWLFGGFALIALSLGMLFTIPYQTVHTASIRADQTTGSIRSVPTLPNK